MKTLWDSKKHKAGQWKKPCRGCGKEMVFKYHCHMKTRNFCGRVCYQKYQLRVPIKNQTGMVRLWTEEEDQNLKKMIRTTLLNNKAIGKELGRTGLEVGHRLTKLGLQRSKQTLSAMHAIGGAKNKGNHRPDLAKNRYIAKSGKDNLFYGKKHSPEVRKIISEKAKAAGTFVRLSKDPEFQRKRMAALLPILKDPELIKKRVARLVTGPNKPEKKMIELLGNFFPGEYEYTGDGKLVISGLVPDFVNEAGKKIIEVFGEPFHDPQNTFLKEIPYIRTEWGRIKIFAKKGYATLIVWTKEFRDMKELERKVRRFHCE